MSLWTSANRAWLRWSEEDVLPMSRVIGPEHASQLYAPFQLSLVRGAAKRRVILSPGLEQRLARAVALRRELRAIRRLPDTGPRLGDLRLRAHQRVALLYLERFPAYLLADQPGVGKTPVAIRWAEHRAGLLGHDRRAAVPSRVLVVTPNSAKDQWAREIARWSTGGWPVTIVQGTIPEQRRALRRSDGWVVAHWESLVHAKVAAVQRPWSAVILDEVQAIANRKAKRSETAWQLETPNRIGLTGHPFANSPHELWSILRFLYPEQYRSFWRFFHMHVKAHPKPFGGFDIIGARQPKLLRWELAPFTLRRTKRQVFPSLPPVSRIPRSLELPPSGRAEYERLRKQFFVELRAHRGERRILAIPSVLARITRLRQYLVDPGLLGARQPSLKYPVIRELIDELDGPPVIFTSFRQAAVRLRTFLRGERDIGLIAGRMARGAVGRTQAAFLAGDLRALIVVTQAGGVALNLGKYGYVIFLDLPWTARDLEQAEGRVDRPEEGTGKLVPTTSFRLIVRDTYEPRIEQKLEGKFSMFTEVFTADALEALFA